MTMEQIIEGVKTLAQSKDLYRGAYKILMALKKENGQEFIRIKNEWESYNFKDMEDFKKYMES